MKKIITAIFISLFSCTSILCASQLPREEVEFSFPEDELWIYAGTIGNPSDYTLEYVPMGENVNNWSQMFTITFTSNQIKSVKSVKDFFFYYVERNKKTYENKFKYTLIKETENDVLFMQVIPASGKFGQFKYENLITRFINSSEGFYSVHYIKRSTDMSEKTKEKWLHHIQEAKIVKKS